MGLSPLKKNPTLCLMLVAKIAELFVTAISNAAQVALQLTMLILDDM